MKNSNREREKDGLTASAINMEEVEPRTPDYCFNECLLFDENWDGGIA